jgi:CRP-like cAMP-binding protein
MYKPIINNFIIFKGLENSNCIVQLVTAFKPIYSIKNDILFQEGDFIEEVIFVKTGVVSLEIGIDLNKPKESIIAYLKKITDRDKIFIDHDSEILNYLTLGTTSTFMNNINSIQKDIFENKSRHNLKVLDIRKNEHFGETLMFLNERTFLTAKVKSKKAELFFLKKEEVIKIFSNFPNIWNRINKKSIYNMRQIKITVRKVLLNFCSMCGIQIYNDINEVKIKKSSPITKNKLAKKKSKDKGVKSMAKYEEKKIIELSNKEDNGDFSSIIKNANPIILKY